MSRMHHPEKGNQKRSQLGNDYRLLGAVPERNQESAQQEVQQHSAGDVEQHIGQVKAVKLCIAKEIVPDEGDVLDRPVMGGKGIWEKVMAEGLQDEQWTLDEWVVSDQVEVIPKGSAL